jgi:hypothetical protein
MKRVPLRESVSSCAAKTLSVASPLPSSMLTSTRSGIARLLLDYIQSERNLRQLNILLLLSLRKLRTLAQSGICQRLELQISYQKNYPCLLLSNDLLMWSNEECIIDRQRYLALKEGF